MCSSKHKAILSLGKYKKNLARDSITAAICCWRCWQPLNVRWWEYLNSYKSGEYEYLQCKFKYDFKILQTLKRFCMKRYFPIFIAEVTLKLLVKTGMSHLYAECIDVTSFYCLKWPHLCWEEIAEAILFEVYLNVWPGTWTLALYRTIHRGRKQHTPFLSPVKIHTYTIDHYNQTSAQGKHDK